MLMPLACALVPGFETGFEAFFSALAAFAGTFGTENSPPRLLTACEVAAGGGAADTSTELLGTSLSLGGRVNDVRGL